MNGGAVFEEPLHREDGAGQRVLADGGVRIGLLVEQQLDELERVHVTLGDRIIAAFDVAVVGGDVEGRPSAAVGQVRIRAALEQHGCQLVMAVVDRRQQRGPAVVRRQVDVGAAVEQDLCRVEVAFARGKDQRRQSAAVGAHESGFDDRIVARIGGRGVRRRGCAALTCTALASGTTDGRAVLTSTAAVTLPTLALRGRG